MANDAIRALRHTLHRCAERFHQEREIACVVEEYLRTTQPDKLLTGVAEHGLLALFGGP